MTIEAGYFITHTLAVEFSGGIPPTTIFSGEGSIAGLGELGKTKYGPAVLSLDYYFNGLGAMRPYLGIGEAYAFIFSTQETGTGDYCAGWPQLSVVIELGTLR
jgi:outer membrane protein